MDKFNEDPKLVAQILATWIADDPEYIPPKMDPEKKFVEFTGKQLAAMFIICIQNDKTLINNIFNFLSEYNIEVISFEVTRIEAVSDNIKEYIFKNMENDISENKTLSFGGIDCTRSILENSIGAQRAINIINRLTSNLQVRPFDFIRRCNPAILLDFIQQEHPQTIAVILSHLEPNKSSCILQNLPNELQSNVIMRIATMNQISPEVLREVERVLEKKLSSLTNEDYLISGGVESVTEILNLVDRATEKQIIETLEDEDPELAEEIKKRMFVFEDLIMLDDRAIQKVMREVDSQELAKALKNTDVEIQDKIFRNMSKRAVAMLKEDIDYIGPMRLKDVEESQQKIVSTIRHLEETGEIIVYRCGENELVDTKIESKYEKSFYDFIKELNKEKIKFIIDNISPNDIIKSLIWVQPEIKNKILSVLKFKGRIKYKYWIYKAKKRVFDLNEMYSCQKEIMNLNLITNEESNG